MTHQQKLIRIAYANPELRPEILKQAGFGYQYIPNDVISLGFKGSRATVESAAVGKYMEKIVEAVRKRYLATLIGMDRMLQRCETDVNPEESRAAIALAYDDLCDNLRTMSEKRIHAIPHRR